MRRILALAAVLAGAATAAQAAELSVPMNHSVRLPLAGPAQSVVVGSPAVVDVAVVDSRTVYVSGKSPGDTDVTVIDPLGRVVFRGDVRVAGGSSVSVFRGSARTDATCAPYCSDTVHDTMAATGSLLSSVATAVKANAPAQAMGAGVSNPMTATKPN